MGQRGKLSLGIKGCILVIFHPSQIFSHDLIEKIIHTVQHRTPAAEVFVKIDPVSFAPGSCGIAAEFFHKQIRTGQAEPVNALLYISYHEDIVFSLFHPGYRGQDLLLDQVAVLILVDHDFRKLVCQFPGSLGPYILSRTVICQDLQSIVLQIGKIQDIFLLFFLFIGLHKGQGQIHQDPYRPGCRLEMLQDFFR